MTWFGVTKPANLILTVASGVRSDTALVSTDAAIRERRAVSDEEIGRIVRGASARVHVDGWQAVGKIPIDLKNTNSICCAVGPQVHARRECELSFAAGVSLSPLIIGGAQSKDVAPALSVPNIVGLGAACRLRSRRVTLGRGLRNRLETRRSEDSNARLHGAAIARRASNTSTSRWHT